MTRGSLKRKLLLPFRFAKWTIAGQLPQHLELRAKAQLVLQSGLFDPDFYLEHNPDVAQAGADPAEHYLTSGAFTRNPHPLFDTHWYLAQNPDLASTGANPLLDYLDRGWKLGRTPHPLFDVAFYLDENPDLKQSGVEPLAHYLRSGASEGRDPHPLFDSDFYLAQNPDIAAGHLNPLAHYVSRGWRERRNPNPFFDVAFYLSYYPDIAQTGGDPLLHYAISAASEKRDPHPAFDTHFYLQRYPEIQGSGILPLADFLRNPDRDPNRYFNVAYYWEQNPGVPRTNVAAVEHYLRAGASEGRNPHPIFDTAWYLAKYPDVAASGENPLLHFLRRGRTELRDPHPLFDSNFYLNENPSFRRPDFSPTDHYLHSGGMEARDPHPLFDSDWYLAQLPDAGISGENPLVHYLRRGWKEKRSPSPFFDGAYYLDRNPDVAHGNISSLHHYLVTGAAEGRDPSGAFDTDWYVAQNPEILAAGWNPLVHYVCVGLEEGRRPRPLKQQTEASEHKQKRPRIVFVSGEPHTPGHYYRVANLASSLAPAYFETLVLTAAEANLRLDEIAKADLVWIWRARLSAQTAALVSAARDAGAVMVFDVDDLMFRPELAKTSLIDGIRTQNMSESEVRSFYQSVKLMVEEADRCTTPTIPLAREIRDLHKPATVIPNGFNAETLERSRAAVRARRAAPDDGIVRIGYASGTLTHQRDFAVAEPALAAILRENSSARLVLFRGATEVTEFPELAGFAEQIEWRDRVPVEDLLTEYARFDINIAPLETGNRYCEAKSELKFFEAALVGVPTVASPTRPFADAIQHGQTGFLAKDFAEWHHALERLVSNRDLRRFIADQAYQQVLWLYGPERRRLLVTRLINELLAPAPLRFELFRSEMEIDTPAALPAIAVPEYDVLFQSPRKAASRVSVVIPLFNYGYLLGEALESVRQQTMRDIDLIVADDRSTDNSAAMAYRWLSQHASEFNMVALLQNRHNSKLGRTRNAAVHFSDTELFMALDPDNALAPDCLEKCMAALDDTGAAFAYPTINLFGDRTGEIGVTEYDPARFPCANYIDAMAMVRKACWIAVGGYSHLEPMGWEDYEFWCKMAEKGFFGIRVQETAARYRTHGTSMLATITELPENKPRVVDDLNSRHPWLQLRVTETSADERLTAASASRAQPVHPVASHDPKGLDGLLAILHCPESGERLVRKDDSTLVSEVTGRRWPVVCGRPVFTREGRNIKIQREDHVSNEVPEQAKRLIEEAGGLVLNLSAGATTVRFPNVVELEYTLFKHTDVAGDVHRLPFQDESFEAVVCLNAFEHYRDPEAAMDEIRRVLKPAGRVLIHTAFLQPLHEAPHHYYNCTEFGLRHWMRHLQVETIRVSPNFNPGYAFSWLASEAEYGFRQEISNEAGDAFAEARLRELAEFWRNPESRESSELWRLFERLPPTVQRKLAAGWEAIGRKR